MSRKPAHSKTVWSIIIALVMVPVVVATCGVFMKFSSHGEVKGTQSALPSIDSFIMEQMMAQKIPGLAIAIVQGDEITYLKGFGVTSLNNPSPVTPQTVFDIASASKSFTALGVLLLYSDGLIDLDQPVSSYLPDFQTDEREMSDQITVRHLLHQTSGFPSGFSEPLAYHSGSDAMEKLVGSTNKIHLNHIPGSSFAYADINYCLLGALIEKVSGMTFEDYMEQRVFIPLDMRHTTLRPNEAARMERADGHQLMFGQVITRNIPIYRSALPAGWVMSSAEDMGKWLILQLNSGRLANRQVFPSELIEEMHTPGVSFSLNHDEVGYGMGWFCSQSIDDLSVIWHGGDTPNFLSEMILIPEQQLGITMLVNSQNSATAHSIAAGVASLILTHELHLPTAPWWASWPAADSIAIGVAIFSLLLIGMLLAYFWWLWGRFRQYRRYKVPPSYIIRSMKTEQIVLPMMPIMSLGILILAAFIVTRVLLGFNPFWAIFQFRMFAPPGLWISGMMLLAVICLWAVALVGLLMLRSMSKSLRTGHRVFSGGTNDD